MHSAGQPAKLAASMDASCVTATGNVLNTWGCSSCGAVLSAFDTSSKANVYNIGRSNFYVKTAYRHSPPNPYGSTQFSLTSAEVTAKKYTLQFRGTVYSTSDTAAVFAAMTLESVGSNPTAWLALATSVYTTDGAIICVVCKAGGFSCKIAKVGNSLQANTGSQNRQTYTCVLDDTLLQAYLNGAATGSISNTLSWDTTTPNQKGKGWIGQVPPNSFGSNLEVTAINIFASAKTASEVETLHSALVAAESFNPPLPPPRALIHLDCRRWYFGTDCSVISCCNMYILYNVVSSIT